MSLVKSFFASMRLLPHSRSAFMASFSVNPEAMSSLVFWVSFFLEPVSSSKTFFIASVAELLSLPFFQAKGKLGLGSTSFYFYMLVEMLSFIINY